MRNGVGLWVVMMSGALVAAVAVGGAQASRDTAPAPRGDVPTYAKDVAPIVQTSTARRATGRANLARSPSSPTRTRAGGPRRSGMPSPIASCRHGSPIRTTGRSRTRWA